MCIIRQSQRMQDVSSLSVLMQVVSRPKRHQSACYIDSYRVNLCVRRNRLPLRVRSVPFIHVVSENETSNNTNARTPCVFTRSSMARCLHTDTSIANAWRRNLSSTNKYDRWRLFAEGCRHLSIIRILYRQDATSRLYTAYNACPRL